MSETNVQVAVGTRDGSVAIVLGTAGFCMSPQAARRLAELLTTYADRSRVTPARLQSIEADEAIVAELQRKQNLVMMWLARP